jgi:sarcosine oxidase delta subunit
VLPTHPVPCPHCGKTLYHAVSLEDGIDAGAAESPKVESDALGYFMRCPYCAKRVGMERMVAGNAAAWRIAGRS